MKLKFFVYCPDSKKIISAVISAAALKGAGVYGHYSHVAFMTHGTGHWRTEQGAKPYEGKVGKITRSPVVRLEMTCEEKDMAEIAKAVKKVHPWEQVDIECVALKKIL